MNSRQRFVERIESLQQDVLRMGARMEEAVEKSIYALVNQELELAKKVIKEDDVIDRLEKEIEETCISIIAMEQPVARDLRTIFTVLKISSDLERMADNAVNIAKVARKIGKEEHIKPLIDIPRMAQLAVGMVRDSLDSYLNLDTSVAREIIKRDEEIDDLNNQVFRELLTYMMQDPHTITQATYLILVARYLERIGDHATNIAEWTIYLEEGEMV